MYVFIPSNWRNAHDPLTDAQRADIAAAYSALAAMMPDVVRIDDEIDYTFNGEDEVARVIGYQLIDKHGIAIATVTESSISYFTPEERAAWEPRQ